MLWTNSAEVGEAIIPWLSMTELTLIFQINLCPYVPLAVDILIIRALDLHLKFISSSCTAIDFYCVNCIYPVQTVQVFMVLKIVYAESSFVWYYIYLSVFWTQLQSISSEHYSDIVEERSVCKLCAYPLCNNEVTNVGRFFFYSIWLNQQFFACCLLKCAIIQSTFQRSSIFACCISVFSMFCIFFYTSSILQSIVYHMNKISWRNCFKRCFH